MDGRANDQPRQHIPTHHATMGREVHWLDESLRVLKDAPAGDNSEELQRFAINVAGAIRQLERTIANLKDRQRQHAAELRILKRNRPGMGSGTMFEVEAEAQRPENCTGRRPPTAPPPPPGQPQRRPPAEGLWRQV